MCGHGPPRASHGRAWLVIACGTSTTMHKGRFPPPGNVFQVSSLFTSQLVLKLCLEYNNLFVRTNEKPPYIYIYTYMGHTYIYILVCMYVHVFFSARVGYLSLPLVVWCSTPLPSRLRFLQNRSCFHVLRSRPHTQLPVLPLNVGNCCTINTNYASDWS